MSNFAAYARHYDALYSDKDYAAETKYLTEVIWRYAPDAAKLLDVGCGTGRHAMLLGDAGFTVTGVDRSEEMLEVARQAAAGNNAAIDFVKADIRDFDLGVKFDAAVAVFHVMSYLTVNADVISTLKTIRQHLQPNALFIFDFWYGPGVLADQPTQRLKLVENDGVEIMRFATPCLQVNDNLVAINYEMLLLDQATGQYNRLNEQHLMRYFFKPEIELMLDAAAFGLVGFTRWMAHEVPDVDTWHVLAVARAV